MKIKIVIQTHEVEPSDDPFKTRYRRRQSEVWSGELEILKDNEYLAKISVIAEGEPQPICDIPFAIGIGHYLWIPPHIDTEPEDDAYNLN